MDELMLDGNAVAELLQEVFAVEMTTAIGPVAAAVRPDRSAPRTSTEAPASCSAAHTATTCSPRSSRTTRGLIDFGIRT
jgi:hypothetical protein